ncbi:tetratricopeptide repeat protein [Fontimonas sp. SYSU GA230001]|uniref:tetratricopeptide repeat protein n=1 Tax=Fontimonas sp. SYSU GA230001 TaxID=3142450 RepID=UPI0032B3A6A5
MPLPYRCSCCALALSALLGGCATLAPPARPAGPSSDFQSLAQDAPSEPLQSATAQAQFHVLAGEMAAGRDDPALAAREFLAALALIDDADLAQRATALAVTARDEDLALTAARRWLELEPDAADPREVVASLSIRRGDLTTTLEQSRALIEGHAGGIGDGFLHVAQVLMQAGRDRADAALAVMQQLVGQWPEDAGAHHGLGVLALHFKRLELAEAAARKAQALEPKDRRHTLLLIGVWVRQGHIDEADAQLEKLLPKGKDAIEARMGYARLLLENGQRAAARRQLEQILKLDRRNVDAHYALGVLAFNAGDQTTATDHFLLLLDGPRANEAAMQLGRIAEARRDYVQALAYYARVSQGPASLDAASRRALVLGRMNRIDDARVLLRNLRERYPQYAVRFYLTEGEILLNGGDNDAALSLYSDALAEDRDNTELLYGRSLAYERLQRIDLAERDLRQVLSLQPDDARALNALGYMLVVHTQRYAEAETAIARAIALEPDDAAINDSMGWLQYKLGRPEQALTWLKRAYAQLPDPEVAAHLGEVLWVLNDREQARAIWDAALRNDPQHPVLLETIERLNP